MVWTVPAGMKTASSLRSERDEEILRGAIGDGTLKGRAGDVGLEPGENRSVLGGAQDVPHFGLATAADALFVARGVVASSG